MKQISPQEFFVGFAAVVTTVFVLGWWGVLLAALCGVLWMLGGTYDKAIRRWGFPALWLAGMSLGGNFGLKTALAAGVGVAVLYMGDGFPDHRPTTKDAGSWLGRLVERFFPDDKIGGPLTKWLIAALFQLCWIPYLIG